MGRFVFNLGVSTAACVAVEYATGLAWDPTTLVLITGFISVLAEMRGRR